MDAEYPLDLEPPGAELTEQGKNIRGVYVPLYRLPDDRIDKFVTWVVDRLGADAVVLDIKDDKGRVTFTQDLSMATGRVHGYAKNLKEVVDALHDQGVYVIGRLVCFKDQFLAKSRPETAVLDRRTGRKWRDKSGQMWVDPFSRLAHQHIAEVAFAAEQLGFDEIQLDYVRFPVDTEARYALFMNRKPNRKRHEAIAALLYEVDAVLGIPLSVDVFGLTAFHMGDPNGLGQSLEHLAPYIDAISPMLYLANWPANVWQNPSLSLVQNRIQVAVQKIRERLGDDIAVRPLLQAFPFRAEELFGQRFIHGQIQAAQSAGASGYLFWNPNGTYTPVSIVWSRLD